MTRYGILTMNETKKGGTDQNRDLHSLNKKIWFEAPGSPIQTGYRKANKSLSLRIHICKNKHHTILKTENPGNQSIVRVLFFSKVCK